MLGPPGFSRVRSAKTVMVRSIRASRVNRVFMVAGPSFVQGNLRRGAGGFCRVLRGGFRDEEKWSVVGGQWSFVIDGTISIFIEHQEIQSTANDKRPLTTDHFSLS